MSRIKTYLLGRSPECDIVIHDKSLSRRHAEVVCQEDGQVYVTDRASTNGSYVWDGSGWRKIRQVLLMPGDAVRLGDVELTGKQLRDMCMRRAAKPSRQADNEERGRQKMENGLDPAKKKVRDPMTGEIVDSK